jgi:hypothetical protein
MYGGEKPRAFFYYPHPEPHVKDPHTPFYDL